MDAITDSGLQINALLGKRLSVRDSSEEAAVAAFHKNRREWRHRAVISEHTKYADGI